MATDTKDQHHWLYIDTLFGFWLIWVAKKDHDMVLMNDEILK
jgi:hypothetical protein